MQSGDGLVIFLIILALGLWAFLYIRGRLKESVDEGVPVNFLPEEEVEEDEATRLLNNHGYHVICGKKRIPIGIQVNGQETLHSRLFFDYIAEKDGSYFTVKLAKERKPLERTGSSVRDRLLIYQFIYPQTAGVLYVDVQENKIDRFIFELDVSDE